MYYLSYNNVASITWLFPLHPESSILSCIQGKNSMTNNISTRKTENKLAGNIECYCKSMEYWIDAKMGPLVAAIMILLYRHLQQGDFSCKEHGLTPTGPMSGFLYNYLTAFPKIGPPLYATCERAKPPCGWGSGTLPV